MAYLHAMHSTATRSFALGAALLTGALLSACGGEGAQQSAPAPSHSEHSHGAEHSHHAGQADMGDPSATPADQIEGAQLRTGQFELLDTRPPGFDGTAGTAWLALHDGGTTVTVRMTGLQPGEQYVSHLHAQSCAQDAGGPHFKFDPQGPEEPPNEVHLGFTADERGEGGTTVNNDRSADAAKSIVVHQAEGGGKIACADF
ncbi:MAG: hypothetical protein ABS918_06230 [Saccharopolyspora rectivirgula]